MKRHSFFYLSLFLPLLFISCEPDITVQEADLRVQVKGYLSGNSREGMQVRLYSTRQDARNRLDPLTPPLWTDEYGEVEFFGLFVNKKYFIRVDAAAANRVRSSGKLDYGANNCVIKIL